MDEEKSRLEQFREFVETDPSDTFSRYALGMEYMGEEDYENAITQFEEVIRLEPENTAAFFQAGIAAQRSDHLDRAREFLNRGIHVAESKKDTHARDEMKAALEDLESNS